MAFCPGTGGNKPNKPPKPNKPNNPNKPSEPSEPSKPSLPVKPPSGARDCLDVMKYGGSAGVNTIIVNGNAVKVECLPNGYMVCIQATIVTVIVTVT